MTEGEHDFEIHHSHRDVTGGWLRPAVFGVSDGLVSNFALIAGVAGGTTAAGATTNAVILAGFAGLAAELSRWRPVSTYRLPRSRSWL